MSEFTDDQLSAFLDDALAPEERAELAQALMVDDQLAARLEELRGADAAFAEALSAIDDRPLPEGLEAMLDAADAPKDAGPVPQAANDNGMWGMIAASVAVLAAFAAGGLLNPLALGGGDEAVNMAAFAGDPAVQEMLEGDLSGTQVVLASGQRASTRLSFMGPEGKFCREFVVGDQAGSTVAIACRKQEQGWDVVLAAAGPALVGESDGYTPASDDNAAFDAAVSALMTSDSADAETESEWIESRWNAAP